MLLGIKQREGGGVEGGGGGRKEQKPKRKYICIENNQNMPHILNKS